MFINYLLKSKKRGKHKREIAFWCDMLSCKELIFFLIIKCFRKDITIRYTGISRFSSKIVLFLHQKNFCHWIVFHQIKFIDNPENGEGIFPSIERLSEKVSESFYSSFLSSNEYLPKWAKNNSRYSNDIKNYLKNLYISNIHQQIATIITARHIERAEYRLRKKRKDMIFVLNAIPESFFLKKVLDDVCIIHIAGFITYLWIAAKTFFSGLLFGYPKILKSLFSKSPVMSPDLHENKEFKVLVEYNSISFSNKSRSNLFWLQDGRFDPQNIVLYFDRNDSPASQENIEKIEEKKFGWINIYNIRALSHPFKVLLKSVIEIWKIPLPWSPRFYNVWKWLNLIRIASAIEYWRDIFRNNNVKIIIQHQEASPFQFIQSMAINLEGGIMLGFIWSSPFSKLVSHCRPYDVYFVWGRLSRDWVIYNKYSVKWLLQSGFIWDNLKNDAEIEGLNIRKNFSKKVEYVMTLFDESYNPYLDSGLILFYKTFLTYAIKHSNWGILIKPKGYWQWDQLPDSSINKMILKLSQEKRCIEADPMKSPLIACTCSDITISFFINSAAVIASVHGTLSLNWDVLGCIFHPLYKYGKKEGIFIYRTVDEIINKLDNFQHKKNSDLHNKWNSASSSIDPFRDGSAGNRVGKFIQDYIRQIESGLEKDEALSKACNKYKKDNGEETALNLSNHSDKYNADNLWYESDQGKECSDDLIIENQAHCV